MQSLICISLTSSATPAARAWPVHACSIHFILYILWRRGWCVILLPMLKTHCLSSQAAVVNCIDGGKRYWTNLFEEKLKWFSKQLIHYTRERIQLVCKGLKLNSSTISSGFHQLRLDCSSRMRCSWKELLKHFGIKGTEVDPLLEQSVYHKFLHSLLSEYFT